MGKRPIKIFLVIAILSILFLFPAHSRYINLSETTLFPVDINFENPDPDDQLDGQWHELGALLSSVFSITFLARTDFIEQSYLFSFPLTSHSQNESILRC
jgi:hypothetical protein